MSSKDYNLPVNYDELHWRERRLVREQYIREQKGKCYYCQNDLDYMPTDEVLLKPVNWSLFPEGFKNHPIHLQHNHNTGMTEGAVHMYCNAVMWQYEGR